VAGVMATGARTPADWRANSRKEPPRCAGAMPATACPLASARNSATGSASTLKWRGSKRLKAMAWRERCV
jgi:hypothetical protein